MRKNTNTILDNETARCAGPNGKDVGVYNESGNYGGRGGQPAASADL